VPNHASLGDEQDLHAGRIPAHVIAAAPKSRTVLVLRFNCELFEPHDDVFAIEQP